MKQWAKRVILFGVDGAGTFFEQTPTPNIDRIFRDGAVCRFPSTPMRTKRTLWTPFPARRPPTPWAMCGAFWKRPRRPGA